LANVVTEIFRHFERNWIPRPPARTRARTVAPRQATAARRVSVSQLIYPVRFAAQAVRDAKEDLRAREVVYEKSPTEHAAREILAAQMRLAAARFAVRKLSRYGP